MLKVELMAPDISNGTRNKTRFTVLLNWSTNKRTSGKMLVDEVQKEMNSVLLG